MQPTWRSDERLAATRALRPGTTAPSRTGSCRCKNAVRKGMLDTIYVRSTCRLANYFAQAESTVWENEMKVFISWSGKQSKAVASSLRDWLPVVIPGCEPWMSSSDITAGARWFTSLRQELQSTEFCIICLTPDNLRSPWIYFEAGAISTNKDAKVCGFLTGVSLSQLPGPFAQFQCVQSNAEGAWSLVQSVCQSDAACCLRNSSQVPSPRLRGCCRTSRR